MGSESRGGDDEEGHFSDPVNASGGLSKNHSPCYCTTLGARGDQWGIDVDGVRFPQKKIHTQGAVRQSFAILIADSGLTVLSIGPIIGVRFVGTGGG